MKTWKFFLYRDTFLPGSDGEEPEVRVVKCKDPYDWAVKHCKGAIHKIDWDPA